MCRAAIVNYVNYCSVINNKLRYPFAGYTTTTRREKSFIVITRELPIINKLGLHARAAAKLVKLSSSFEASIDIEKDGQRVNSKSIMGVMMLAASCGSQVTLTAEGNDETAAMNAITDLINRRFDEEE